MIVPGLDPSIVLPSATHTTPTEPSYKWAFIFHLQQLVEFEKLRQIAEGSELWGEELYGLCYHDNKLYCVEGRVEEIQAKSRLCVYGVRTEPRPHTTGQGGGRAEAAQVPVSLSPPYRPSQPECVRAVWGIRSDRVRV